MAKYKASYHDDKMLQNWADNQTIIWGVAYKINDQTLHVDLKQKPIQGIIKATGGPCWHKFEFVSLNKKGQPQNYKAVHVNSRCYADTEAEAEELYNELVQERIDRLLQIANETKNDFI